jgi:hypothetical protein
MTMTALICVELEGNGAYAVIDVGECTKRKRLIIPSSVVEVLCHKFRLCYVTFTAIYMHIVGPQLTVTQLRTRSFLRPPGEQKMGLNDHFFLENLSQFIKHSLVTRRHITSEAS